MKKSQYPGTEIFCIIFYSLLRRSRFTSGELNTLLIILYPSILLTFIKEGFIFLLGHMAIKITLIMKMIVEFFS